MLRYVLRLAAVACDACRDTCKTMAEHSGGLRSLIATRSCPDSSRIE